MKKHLKHTLLFALLLGCLAALFALQSAAAYHPNDINYFKRLQRYIDTMPVKVVDHVVYLQKKDDDAYMVISYFDSEEAMQQATSIRIKDEIDGKPVTSICVSYVNRGSHYTLTAQPPVAENVTSIRFSKNTINLNKYAFSCLPNLTKYKIPNGTVNVSGAFMWMDNLTAISIPASVKRIGDHTFSMCTNLKKVVFKGDVETIGKHAFSACGKLTKINLPDSVQEIGREAFVHTGLRSLTVPASCRRITLYAFSNCPLKYVTFREVNHNHMIILGEGVFQNCTGLKKVTFPANAKLISMRDDVFKGDAALRVVLNTQVVREIGANAFADCAALESFTLSSKLKSVHPAAFSGCSSLKQVKILTKKADALHVPYVDGCFVSELPDTCRVYVKTNAMARACYDAGFKGRVTVKADLK